MNNPPYSTLNNKIITLENKIKTIDGRISKVKTVLEINKTRLKKMDPISLNLTKISEWRSDWVWPQLEYDEDYEADILFFYDWTINIGKIPIYNIPAVKTSIITRGINDYDALWNLNFHGVFFTIHKVFKIDEFENVTLLTGVSHKSWEGVKPVQFSLYVSYKNEREYY